MSMLQDYLRDLAPLVNVDCGSKNPAGVTTVANVMKSYYESIGFHCELVDLGPECGNALLARNKPESTTYDILMNAHLDTVFPDGEATKRPLTIDETRQVAMGPGCADCKSGILAMFYALKNANPEDLKRLSICVALNPDEEIGSPYATEWLAQLAKQSRMALIFEAARPQGELVRSRKGVATYVCEFKGVASHAGNNPKAGRNANIAAMKFALAAYALASEDKGTTVNPGIIQGGTGANVISDYCRIEIDTRYWKDADGDELQAQLQALMAQTWVDGVSQTMTVQSRMPAMPFSDETKWLSELMTQAARLEGFETTWVDAGGGSDGNHIASMGIAVIDGIGPAGGGFHCDKEYLRLDTVEERIRMVSRFLSLVK